MTMLDATAVCPECGFTVPPGAEPLLQKIGVDRMIGDMIPGKTLVCPICGRTFKWRDPNEKDWVIAAVEEHAKGPHDED